MDNVPLALPVGLEAFAQLISQLVVRRLRVCLAAHQLALPGARGDQAERFGGAVG
jgi:hypothetical protein